MFYIKKGWKQEVFFREEVMGSDKRGYPETGKEVKHA